MIILVPLRIRGLTTYAMGLTTNAMGLTSNAMGLTTNAMGLTTNAMGLIAIQQIFHQMNIFNPNITSISRINLLTPAKWPEKIQL